MPASLDPDLLRAFVAVSDTASFTRAAERLNRTQAAVSLQIKRLEDGLGRRLFERGGRRILLSPDGERMMGFARRLLRLHDEALDAFGAPQPEGTVRLGTPDDYATAFLPPVLSRFGRTFPRVQVNVRCEISADLIAAVDQDDLDLALITRTTEGPAGVPVRREALVWVAAKPDTEALSETPLPVALFPRGCLFRELVTAGFATLGQPWRLAFESPSHSALVAAVASGLAVTVLARGTVPPGMAILGAGGAPGSPLPRLPSVGIGLYDRPFARTAAVDCLRRHILSELSDDSARFEAGAIEGRHAGRTGP